MCGFIAIIWSCVDDNMLIKHELFFTTGGTMKLTLYCCISFIKNVSCNRLYIAMHHNHPMTSIAGGHGIHHGYDRSSFGTSIDWICLEKSICVIRHKFGVQNAQSLSIFGDLNINIISIHNHLRYNLLKL